MLASLDGVPFSSPSNHCPSGEMSMAASVDGETSATDPRLAALALSSNFDAAEAEAATEAARAEAEASPADDEIPTIGDDALAARLAGLVPPEGEGEGRPTRATS